MLKQRILTAAVLLAVFIAALCAPTPVPFLALTLLMIAAAGWEWSRLAGWPGWRAWVSGVLCVVVCAKVCILMLVFAYSFWTTWYVVGLLWIVVGAALLWCGPARWPAVPRWLRWGMGMAMLIMAWLALAVILLMRTGSISFLLSVLALVWAADIGAYFCGRALGGKFTGERKLAPSISPGKSWEGALGGFIGVLLTGAVWMVVDHVWQLWPSFYSLLWASGPLWFFGGLALLTAMSVVGDLSESLVKRAAGVKDSSALLPGHGGVLDRIDALLPTLPLALALTQLAQGARP